MAGNQGQPDGEGEFPPVSSLKEKRDSEQPTEIKKQELLPLSLELEQLFEDSWEDNKELYWALKDS